MAIDRCNGLHPDYYIRHIVLNTIHLQNFQQIYVHCVKVQFLCQKKCNSTSKYSHFFVMFSQYIYQYIADVSE
jgi:hypothetical protein